MYLLDTNILSELRKSKPHGGVLTWILSLSPEEVQIPVAAIGEIQAGIERTRKSDPSRAVEIEAWLEELCRSRTIVPATEAIFRIWGRLIHNRPTNLFADALIAATAIHLGLTVATRNTKDFEPFGVLVTNPFSARR
jgi:predicted nucleic acid-binding protein